MRDDPITSDMRAKSNIAWFGLDSTGRIGAFESSGFAWIHPSVLESDARRRTLVKYFRDMPISSAVLKHESHFAQLLVEDQADAYLESAAFFAKRGLYVYDVPLSPRRTSEFLLIVEPTQPLKVEVLPEEVQQILLPIRLLLDFTATARFVVE